MLSERLELALGSAVNIARNERHEIITVEHLLYALLDDKEVARVVVACGGHVESLKRSLLEFLSTDVPVFSAEVTSEPQPGTGFQRVLQRAIMHVQRLG